jgi:protein-tyrosine phosphatase
MFKSLLVVCVGNICRSPTAEFLFNRELAVRGMRTTSAGLQALVGNPIDEGAAAVLTAEGHSVPEHRARQLDVAMLRATEIVLTMEAAHTRRILELAPEMRGRVLLLGKWLGETEIPDPYRLSPKAYQASYTLIHNSVQSWISRL